MLPVIFLLLSMTSISSTQVNTVAKPNKFLRQLLCGINCIGATKKSNKKNIPQAVDQISSEMKDLEKAVQRGVLQASRELPDPLQSSGPNQRKTRQSPFNRHKPKFKNLPDDISFD